MAKISVPKVSFVGGEWSPALYGRTDIQAYSNAVRIMSNFFPHTHGGVSNRGGTKHVEETSDSTKESRLIPFQYSVEQAYILEFGDLYMRVFADGGQVTGSAANGLDLLSSSYYWIASGSGTDEYYARAFLGGDPSISEPVTVYENSAESTEGTVGSLAAGEWAYDDNDTLGYDTIYVRLADGTSPNTKSSGYVSAGYVADGAPYELTTLYTEAQVKELKFTQSADVLFITQPDQQVTKFNRYASAYWTKEEFSFVAVATMPTTVVHSAPTGLPSALFRVTSVVANGDESEVSMYAVGGTSAGTITWDADVDAYYFNVYQRVNGVYGLKASVYDNTYTVTSVAPDMSKQPAELIDGVNAGVGACAFFEQRLILARSDAEPQDIWGSITGSYEDFRKSGNSQADDPYNFTLNATKVNEIKWLVPLEELVVGTSGGEWRLQHGGTTDAITPASVDAKMQSNYGSCDIRPIVIDKQILFVEGSKTVVRDLGYNYEARGYTGGNLSLLAMHLFKDYEIVDWCFQRRPDNIVWCVRSDGVLLGLTYMKEHDVYGWHRHITDGEFESVACITNNDGVDDVYFIVKRTIDGTTKRYIETLPERLPVNEDFETDVQDAFFVDCGLTYDSPKTITGATQADPVVITSAAHGISNGDAIDINQVKGMTGLNGVRFYAANVATNTIELTDIDGNDIDGTAFEEYTSGGKLREAVTTISGLDHLEGKTVSVLANGSVVSPSPVVASGEITLTTKASRVHVGLPYVCDLETLDFDFPVEGGGTIQDRPRNIVSAVVRLDKTRDLTIGPDTTLLEPVLFRTDEDYGEPTALFTGDKEMPLEAGEPTEGRIFVRVSTPLPITIIALIARVEYGGN